MRRIIALIAALLAGCSGSGNLAPTPSAPITGSAITSPTGVKVWVYTDLEDVNYIYAPPVACIPGVAFFAPSGYINHWKTEVGGFLPHCIGVQNVPAGFRLHGGPHPQGDYARLQIGIPWQPRETCQMDMYYITSTQAFFAKDDRFGQEVACYVVQKGPLTANFYIEPPGAPPPERGHPFQ